MNGVGTMNAATATGILMLAAGLSTAAAGQGCDIVAAFGGGTLVPAGTAPAGLTAADFDADGATDLAVASTGDDTIRILRGQGNGAFNQDQTISVGAGPEALAARDFDGDGLTDLAVANTDANTVSVLMNTGAGLELDATMAVGETPVDILAADLNGDGAADLATADRAGDMLSILLNDGSGSFPDERTIDAGSAPDALAAADFDADSDLDIAIANFNSPEGLTVLRNAGDATFPDRQAYPDVTFRHAIAAGEINGDGVPDLAVSIVGYAAHEISLFTGDGDGTFTDVGAVPGVLNAHDLAIADLDADGNSDLVAAKHHPDGGVTVIPGNGDGSFDSGVTLFAGSDSAAVAVADFDGNGVPDIAAANEGSGDVGIFLNQCATQPPSIASHPAPVSSVDAGDSLSLSVEATGTGSLDYQWMRRGEPVANGGGVSGAQSSTLTLQGATPRHTDTYTARVSNNFGEAASNEAVVAVRQPCPADLTGPNGAPDGQVTSSDFLTYLDLFAAGCP